MGVRRAYQDTMGRMSCAGVSSLMTDGNHEGVLGTARLVGSLWAAWRLQRVLEWVV